MRLLIADDEPLVRIGIKSSYDWKRAGFEIVGEAADGEETIRLIETEKPDAVILDIKMPKKDGIDVLTEIRQKHYPTAVIILSSFDDFAHVKQAMKLGAIDYFHKPSMDIQEVVHVLHKIKEDLFAGGRESIPERSAAEKGNAIKNMIQGLPHDPAQTQLKERNMYVMLFSIRKYRQILKRYAEENGAFLSNTINNLLGELLNKEQEAEYLQLDQHSFGVFVSHSSTNSAQEAFQHVNEMMVFIHAALKRFINIEVTFGISRAFHSFNDFQTAYQQALRALELRFYHPNDPLFYYQESKLEEKEIEERISKSITSMKKELKEERYDQFAKLLNEWEEFVQSCECMTEHDMKKIYEGLLFMLVEGENHREAAKHPEEFDDFIECSAYYHAALNEHLKAKLMGRTTGYNPLIHKVISYIDQHYHEEISLKLLGDTFHASPNYISRLFKQEVGKGLFEYIQWARIRQAKELMKEPGSKIYEIAERVGFKSQVHFSIVFNKLEGISPKDFRKRLDHFN